MKNKKILIYKDILLRHNNNVVAAKKKKVYNNEHTLSSYTLLSVLDYSGVTQLAPRIHSYRVPSRETEFLSEKCCDSLTLYFEGVSIIFSSLVESSVEI
ncbi:MAG: hypothetical protein WCF23_03770 [Candidatus Nitrosopolaris sp.]